MITGGQTSSGCAIGWLFPSYFPFVKGGVWKPLHRQTIALPFEVAMLLKVRPGAVEFGMKLKLRITNLTSGCLVFSIFHMQIRSLNPS